MVEHSIADREVPASNPGVPYFFPNVFFSFAHHTFHIINNASNMLQVPFSALGLILCFTEAELDRYIAQSPQCWFSRRTAHIISGDL